MSTVGRPDWQAITRSFAGGIIQPPTITSVPANSFLTFTIPSSQLYEVNELQATVPQYCFVELQPRDVNGNVFPGMGVGGINGVDEVELAAHNIGGSLDVVLINTWPQAHFITWTLRGYLGVTVADLRMPYRTMEWRQLMAPGQVLVDMNVPSAGAFDEVAWFFSCTGAGQLNVNEYTLFNNTLYVDTYPLVTTNTAGNFAGVTPMTGRGWGFSVKNPSPSAATEIHLHARARRLG